MLFISCDAQAPNRACDPTQARGGCSVGQKCALNPEGSPSCFPEEEEERGYGDICEHEAQCAPSLSCVRVARLSRCLPICKLNREDRDQDCLRTTTVGEPIAGSEYARCVARIPQQDDLGLCVPPCRPWEPGDCALAGAEGRRVACALEPLLPYTVCARSGDALENTPCGAAERCEEGLSCVMDGGIHRCVELYPESASCPPGTAGVMTLTESDPWSTDANRSEAYQSCWPCVSLPRLSLTLPPYRACLSPARAPSLCSESEPCSCASWGGHPLSLEAPLDDRVLTQLRERFGLGASLWTSAVMVPAEGAEEAGGEAAEALEAWRWASGAPVDPELWTEGEPREGRCAGLSLRSGLLQARGCEEPLFTLCFLGDE